MSEDSENEPDDLTPDSEKGDVAPRDKAVGILLLLVVAGGLWAFMKFGPGVLDRVMGSLTSKAGQVIEHQTKKEVEEKPDPEKVPAAVDVSVEARHTNLTVSEQIIEQLGGAGKAEVRHVAFSDDKARMVVALKAEINGDGKKLLEVFFVRDEYGRFVSKGDWMGGNSSLIIWPK